MKNTTIEQPRENHGWEFLGINGEKLTLLEEAKRYVAGKVSAYVNGASDYGRKEFPPMTLKAWKIYVRKSLAYDIAHHEGDDFGIDLKHLNFIGSTTIEDLTAEYVNSDGNVGSPINNGLLLPSFA